LVYKESVLGDQTPLQDNFSQNKCKWSTTPACY